MSKKDARSTYYSDIKNSILKLLFRWCIQSVPTYDDCLEGFT